MKTYLSKTKLIALSLVTVFATSLTTPSFAKSDDSNKAEIVYVGELNQLPTYRLSLKNVEKEIFYVTVADSEGTVLYTEKVSGKNIVRNYQLSNDVNPNYDLTFTVTNAKGKTVNVYNVSSTKKTINEVSINRIK